VSLQGPNDHKRRTLMNATELREYRRQHLPVFNDNKMKLGVFGQNCSNGCTISHAETTFEPTYKHSVAIAQKADALGFELLVPVGRWLGWLSAGGNA